MSPIDLVWLLVASGMVMLMQAGFCCLESGMVRSKNGINVVAKNVLDCAVAFLVFWAWGYTLLSGHSQAGLFGVGSFLFEPTGPAGAASFLFQAMFCATAATIVAGAVAERMRFGAYLATSVLVSGLIYPVFAHWVWARDGLGGSVGLLGRMGYYDFAGGSVVHVVGAGVALAGVLRLGPRLGRFTSGNDAIQGNNIPLAALGVFLLWFGWLGFNGGSAGGASADVPRILIVTCMGGAAGGVAGTLGSYRALSRVDVTDALNGILAGLVAVCAGADKFTVLDATLVGAAAGLVALWSTRLLYRWKVDDAVAAIPVHGAAGIFGTVSVALLVEPEALGMSSRLSAFGVQSLGAVAAFAFSFSCGWVGLGLISRFISLRVSPEGERVGLNVHEHGATTEILDLLTEMEAHRRVGRFDSPVRAEPHTEVGQVARQYNRVIDAVNTARSEEQRLNHALIESERASAELRGKLSLILESAANGICCVDPDGRITLANPAALQILRACDTGLVGRSFHEVAHLEPEDGGECPSCAAMASGPVELATTLLRRGNDTFVADLVASPMVEDGRRQGCVVSFHDSTDRQKLESDLAQARKLEAVGQLAAGIAHEINTPTQFVGDNLSFAKRGVSRLMSVLQAQADALRAIQQRGATEQDIAELERMRKKLRIPFLEKEIPKALDQSLQGVDRVATIVHAMKDFAHPGSDKKEPVDVNRCLETTIEMGRNVWKYVADVDAQLESGIGSIPGYTGELNQVFLNLLVNAAHALEGRKEKGCITVASRTVEHGVEIRIADNGCGIPEDIRERIFDPFFTTKEVGKGTGQGLAIAWSIVVDKHGRDLAVESEEGVGTSFVIRLPSGVDERAA